MFSGFVSFKLPNGVTYHTGTYQDRLGKLQEHLRQLSILFRKLRLVYDKCNENCAGLDPVPIEVSTFLYVQITAQSHRAVFRMSSFLMGCNRLGANRFEVRLELFHGLNSVYCQELFERWQCWCESSTNSYQLEVVQF